MIKDLSRFKTRIILMAFVTSLLLSLNGKAEAQYYIGHDAKVRTEYFEAVGNYIGNGLTLYELQSKEWYENAATKGNAKAKFILGLMAYEGYRSKQNSKEGLRWYEAAATQGEPEVQYILGIMYRSGLGVEKDIARSEYWYNKACENGIEKGCIVFNEIHEKRLANN